MSETPKLPPNNPQEQASSALANELQNANPVGSWQQDIENGILIPVGNTPIAGPGEPYKEQLPGIRHRRETLARYGKDNITLGPTFNSATGVAEVKQGERGMYTTPEAYEKGQKKGKIRVKLGKMAVAASFRLRR